MNALAEAVQDKDYGAIRTAVALGARAFAVLAPLLSSADEGVRELALRCAARVASPEDVPVLLDRVRHEPEPALRMVAAQALESRVRLEDASAVLEVARDEREAAVRVVLLLAIEPHAASLAADVWARAADAEGEPVAHAVLLACATRAGGAQAAERLPGALAALEPGVLGGLLARAGLFEQPWGWPSLRRLLQDERDAVWVFSELAPDAPPSRRVCDLAADRLRAGLLRAGREAPPAETAYGAQALDALLTESRSLRAGQGAQGNGA